MTVLRPLDEGFQGHENSCRSGSGPFGACAFFEVWWPSVFTSVSKATFNEVFDMGKLHLDSLETPMRESDVEFAIRRHH
jgi:hypothetical protein